MKANIDGLAAESTIMWSSGRALLVAAFVLAIAAFFWTARPLGAQEIYVQAPGHEQDAAPGRTVYPKEGAQMLPGLESLAVQSARAPGRSNVPGESSDRIYTLADALEDALWRRRVVETFWETQN